MRIQCLFFTFQRNLCDCSCYDTLLCCCAGLPPGGDIEDMKRVWKNTKAHAPKPMTMLASLFRSPKEVEKMDLRLKVSREEKNLALFLVRYRQELQKNPDEPDSLKPFTDFIIDVSEKLLVSHVSF